MTPPTTDVRRLVKDALDVVSRRTRLIVVTAVIVSLGISAAVVSVPTSYEVAGKLVVTRERGDLLVTPADLRNFNFGVTAPTLQDMAVHAELLKNRSLVEAVALQLGLDKGGGTNVAEPDRERRLNAQVDAILNGLTIQVVPNSNLIYIRYRTTDATKGAAIVNALIERYHTTYLHIRAIPGVTQLFGDERDRLATHLKKSEAALAAFRNRTTLAAPDAQVDAYSRRLAEAEADATDAQYDLTEAKQRAAVIEDELDRAPEWTPFEWTTRHNPMIQAVEEQLLALEIDEQHLLTLYADTDRRVQDKRAEIEAQKQRLAEVRAHDMVPANEVTELNARRRDLEAQYTGAVLAAQKDMIRAEGARTIAAEMHARVRDLSVADVQKEALLREIKADADAYELYRQKAEEARITTALDDHAVTNVAIGELASRPGTPVGPPKGLSLGFAVAVGLVSGVGGAFLREFFSRPSEPVPPFAGPRRAI